MESKTLPEPSPPALGTSVLKNDSSALHFGLAALDSTRRQVSTAPSVRQRDQQNAVIVLVDEHCQIQFRVDRDGTRAERS
jgi:hypothetical protein